MEGWGGAEQYWFVFILIVTLFCYFTLGTDFTKNGMSYCLSIWDENIMDTICTNFDKNVIMEIILNSSEFSES